MANNLNRCEFIGRLGGDVESRFLPNGDEVVNFSIAVSESWKDKQTGQPQERTEWVRIVAFRGLAGVCSSYLKKGSKVFVSGKFKTRKWTDQNQIERYTTEIVANEMEMLDSKTDNPDQAGDELYRGAAQANQALNSQPQGADSFDDMNDDVPF